MVFFTPRHTLNNLLSTVELQSKNPYAFDSLNNLPPHVLPIIYDRMTRTSKSYMCSLYFKIPSLSHDSIKYINSIFQQSGLQIARWQVC